MSKPIADPTILVPIDASETAEPPSALVELLQPHELVVLGYYPVADQTSIDQARDEFGEETEATVQTIADRFAAQGGGAESVVVFTHNRTKTIDNVAAEYDVDAVLTSGEFGNRLERILVPLRGDDNLERILGFVGVLLRESDATVTLFTVVSSEEEASRGELLVRGAADSLAEDEDIDPSRIDWHTERDSSPPAAISKTSKDYDLLIVGESRPSLTDRILGNVTDQVIDQSTDPLLIVRDK